MTVPLLISAGILGRPIPDPSEVPVPPPTGDDMAWEVVRSSALGGWFPSVAWRLVDHNYPECRRSTEGRGLVVVEPPASPTGLRFVLTVSDPWDTMSPAQVWIAHPRVVAAHRDGQIVQWTRDCCPMRNRPDLARWLQAYREVPA